ncbi:hypothetical protein [Alienimonas chondri]|uniref:Uncharacterized protein n=1 Tax=Alienimonas chondri TaxID=2681879 RepID=A0ABX1VF22_9PLAN|nr:hypothetical protein [Alienimonas chondri]NNJ25868.1 hypothetical protein [Alienimonas chondri]
MPGAIAAFFGGSLGFLTPPTVILGVLFTIEVVRQGGKLPHGEGALSYLLLLTCSAWTIGAGAGFCGAALALRVRRRRHAKWPENLTAFVGAYVAGTIPSLLCCCPPFVVG